MLINNIFVSLTTESLALLRCLSGHFDCNTAILHQNHRNGYDYLGAFRSLWTADQCILWPAVLLCTTISTHACNDYQAEASIVC